MSEAVLNSPKCGLIFEEFDSTDEFMVLSWDHWLANSLNEWDNLELMVLRRMKCSMFEFNLLYLVYEYNILALTFNAEYCSAISFVTIK